MTCDLFFVLFNLDDAASTIALLKLSVVVGITAFIDPAGMGIQCAFCHSAVDNSLAPGFGKRPRRHDHGLG